MDLVLRMLLMKDQLINLQMVVRETTEVVVDMTTLIGL